MHPIGKTSISRASFCPVWVCLVFLFIAGFCGLAQGDVSGQGARWEPKRTRVFLVSLTRFKGGDVAPWGNEKRLDNDFVALFERRGVPKNQIVFLSDEQAESEKIKKEFDNFLAKSSQGELLIFYFSSHGGYNSKTGAFTYSAYDGKLPFQWAFDSIEHSFKGSHVLMFADCCYSGGIVEMAPKHRSAIAYACLSSTYSHNVGFSGWRFFDCVMRGFGGSPVVDLNGDGRIDLDELARFTEKHMAFVAEGKPMFTTTNGFNSKLILADATGKKKDPQIGQYVEALYKGKWQKSEITDLKPGYVKVHHTDKGSTYNDWVTADQVRPFTFQQFQKGSRVEAKGSNGKWRPATVMESWESLQLCLFDGSSSADDEWIGPDKIRAAGKFGAAGSSSNFSGKWVGFWENSSKETGKDSLVLNEDADGNIKGTWSGDVKVNGKRIDANTAQLSGKTAKRSYEFVATEQKGAISLEYVAKRLDRGGSYEGKSTLTPAK
ncbi:MAG: caspase family protein [Syntrophobacteraceae bacterium]|jgi:hypothetical protein